MLIIKSPADLLKYLQTRKALAERQLTALERATPHTGKNAQAVGHAHARGIVYAFGEAIRAVEALLETLAEATPPDPGGRA